MGGLDWILIAIYLLIMLGIGFTSMKKVKTNEDYALAGRSVGNFWVILSLFASWTGLSGLFGTPQYVYQYGIAGWWWWVTFPLGVFIMGMTMAKLLRKRMYTTLSDTVDPLHSSPAIRIVSSLVTVWNYLAWTAGQVAGIILVITTFTNLNGTAAVIIAYIIIVIFTVLGGLRAVLYTDSFQSVLFLLVIGLVIPVVILSRYNVAEAIDSTRQIDGYYSLFSSVPSGTMITWWLLAPAGFIDTMAFQRIFAAKDEKSAKKNIEGAFILMVIFGIVLTFIGVMAHVILPNGSDPATVMLDTVKVILPSGIRGLLVVAFAGVAVSTASSTLLACSTTLEQDVFAVLYKGEYNNKTAILVNRIFVGVIGLLSLVLALKVGSVTKILMYGYSVYVPGLLLPVIARTCNMKIGEKYILSTMIVGVISSVVLILIGEPFPASLGGLLLSAIPFAIGWGCSKKQA